MAQKQLNPIQPMLFSDSRRSLAEYSAGAVAAENRTLQQPANFMSVSELKAYLSTYDPFTYTATNLNIMSVNDMVFAARCIDVNNCKSVSNYMPQQMARTS